MENQKIIFTTGQKVRAINNQPLPPFDVAPPLIIGDEYEIKEIVLDTDGNQHLDVGIASAYNYVRSLETRQDLPRGNKIHWCHPSRFELV